MLSTHSIIHSLRSIIVTSLLVLTLGFSAHANEEEQPRRAPPPAPQIYLQGAQRLNLPAMTAQEFARALALPFVTINFAADHRNFGNPIIFQDEFDGDRRAAFGNRRDEPVARDLYAPVADDLYPTQEELDQARARGLAGHVGALMLNHFFLHLG